MKRLFCLVIFSCLITISSTHAQYLISFGIDAYKTDNRDPVEVVGKAQFGAELNYFLIRQLSLTAGVEYWTAQNRFSVIPGMRLYPVDPFFIRFRPLIGREVDYSAGVGYARRLTDTWRLEIMGDYYFERSNAALRVGVGYRL